MKLNKKRLIDFEDRVENVIEDPVKLIQIVKRIIEMGYQDLDGSYKVNKPVPSNKQVTYYEFIKYYANYQIERAEEHGWDIEQTKKKFRFLDIEKRIKEIGGFSDYSLPEGTVIKYK